MKKFLSLVYIALLASAPLSAKTDLSKYHQEITELSIDENLQSPAIPAKLMPKVRKAMSELEARFIHENLATDLTERDGTVLMVTVPVAELFDANDTLLSKSAASKLQALSHPLRTPDKYKLIIAVHSDDTGTEDYRYYLTQTRAEAIRAWIEEKEIPVEAVVTYGVGYDEPINSEVSRKGRAANRRVEFYFVPGPILIEELKKPAVNPPFSRLF